MCGCAPLPPVLAEDKKSLTTTSPSSQDPAQLVESLDSRVYVFTVAEVPQLLTRPTAEPALPCTKQAS